MESFVYFNIALFAIVSLYTFDAWLGLQKRGCPAKSFRPLWLTFLLEQYYFWVFLSLSFMYTDVAAQKYTL